MRFIALTVVLVFAVVAGKTLLGGGDSARDAAREPTPVPHAGQTDVTGGCPSQELPARGAPIQGSVGVRAGGHDACGNIGMLAPQVFSLTDGATGLPLEGRPGLNAGAGGLESSISPDNRLLVVPTDSRLDVIDLQSWSQVFGFDFPEGVPLAPQAWSADGSKLYLRLGWASRMRTGPSIHNDRRIWELDVTSGTLSRLPDLPFDSLLDLAVSGDGRRLYALAFDRDDRRSATGYGWVVKGEPFLSVVEIGSGQELDRMPLSGLRLGEGEDAITRRPAGVLDDANGRYYVAHADSDAITVIDLATNDVVTELAAARPRESLPRRLLGSLRSFFVSTAEAKGSGWQSRQVALSGDGRLLLVTGMDEISADVDDANDEASGAAPAGLRVIDTQTLKVLHREAGINEFVLSDDGRYLFGIGYASYFKNRWAPQDGAGLKVLDLRTLTLAARVEPGRAYLNVAPTLDGRYLHLTSEGPGRDQMRRDSLGTCDEPCIQLLVDVVEVESLKLVSRYESSVSMEPISRWDSP
jgi:DNA-binding beta-propeller fold protein YncE